MKKSMLLVLCFFLLAALVQQSQAFPFGIKGGLNWSKYQSPTASDPDFLYVSEYNQGWLFGVFANFSLNPKFSIQPEVYYTRIGEKETYDGYVYKELEDYFQIPVLLKFKVMPQKSFTPIILFGPYVGFLSKAKAVDSEGNSEDLSQHFGTDFGLVFSGGVEGRAGKMLLSLEFRYNLGLKDTTTEAESPYITKNSTMVLVAGVGF